MKIVKRKDSNPNLTQYTPMRSMLDDFFTSPSFIDDFFNQSYSSKNLFVDVWEEDDKFFVKMAMPGVDKESINITTSDDSITITGSSSKKEEDKSNRKYYYKAMESSFEQTFNLPTKIDADKADATYSDGVLTVVLPKSEEVKPKKIEIK